MIPKESIGESRKSINPINISTSAILSIKPTSDEEKFEQILQANYSEDTDNACGESSGNLNSESFITSQKQNEATNTNTTTSWLEQIQFKAQYYHFRTNNYAAIVNLQKEGKLGQFRPESVEVIKDPTTVHQSSCSVPRRTVIEPPGSPHRNSLCWNFPRVNFRTLFSAKSLDDILGGSTTSKPQQQQRESEQVPKTLHPPAPTVDQKKRLHSSGISTQEPVFLGPQSRPRSSSSQSQNKIVILGTESSSGSDRKAISASSTPDIQITSRPFGFKYPLLIADSNTIPLSASSSEDNCYFTTKPLRVHPIRNSRGKEGSRSTTVSGNTSPGPLLIVGSSVAQSDNCLHSTTIPPTTVPKKFSIPSILHQPSPDEPSTKKPTGKRIHFLNKVEPIEAGGTDMMTSPLSETRSTTSSQVLGPGDQALKLVVASVSYLQRPASPSTFIVTGGSIATSSSPCSPSQTPHGNLTMTSQLAHSPVTTKITSLPVQQKCETMKPVGSGSEPSPGKLFSSGTNNTNGDNEISRPTSSGKVASCGGSSSKSGGTPNKKISSTSTPPNNNQHHHHQQSSFFTSCCSRRTVSTEEDEQSSNKELSDEDDVDNNDEIARKSSRHNMPKTEIINSSTTGGDSSKRRKNSSDRNAKSKTNLEKNTKNIEDSKTSRRKSQQSDKEKTAEEISEDNMGDLQSPQYVKKTAHMFNTKYSNGTNGTTHNGTSSPSYLNVSRSVSGYSCLTSYGPSSHLHHQTFTNGTTSNYTNGTTTPTGKFFGNARNFSSSNMSPGYKNLLNQHHHGSVDPENCPPPPLPQTAPPLSSPYLVGKNKQAQAPQHKSHSVSSRDHSPSPGPNDNKSIIMQRIERLYGSGALAGGPTASPTVTTTYFWRKRTPPPPEPTSSSERIIPIKLEQEPIGTNGHHDHGIDHDYTNSTQGQILSKSLSIQTDNQHDVDTNEECQTQGKSPYRNINGRPSASAPYPTTTTFVTEIPHSSPGKNDKGTLIKEGPMGQESEILTTYVSSTLAKDRDSQSFTGAEEDSPDCIPNSKMPEQIASPAKHLKIQAQTVNMNKENEIEITSEAGGIKKNGEYFIAELTREKKIIQEMINKAEEKLDGLDEEESGKLLAAIGKARLLINKKFKQFQELCYTNLDQAVNGLPTDETFPTKDEDLAGFWDMVLIQVEQIHGMFNDKPVEKIQNVPKTTSSTKPKVKKGSPPTNTSPSKNAERDEMRRKLLAEKRKAMKEQLEAQQSSNIEPQQSGPAVSTDSEVLIFAPK